MKQRASRSDRWTTFVYSQPVCLFVCRCGLDQIVSIVFGTVIQMEPAWNCGWQQV